MLIHTFDFILQLDTDNVGSLYFVYSLDFYEGKIIWMLLYFGEEWLMKTCMNEWKKTNKFLFSRSDDVQ